MGRLAAGGGRGVVGVAFEVVERPGRGDREIVVGTTGMSNSSSQFEFMYPNHRVNEPSSLGHQPSNAG